MDGQGSPSSSSSPLPAEVPASSGVNSRKAGGRGPCRAQPFTPSRFPRVVFLWLIRVNLLPPVCSSVNPRACLSEWFLAPFVLQQLLSDAIGAALPRGLFWGGRF